MNKSKEYETFRKICLERGWKCTPQRYAVYLFMKGNLTHPTVDDVWTATRKTIPSITRESVFRILTELADLGMIYRMDKIVNACFDGVATNHGHLICERCGKIVDFDLTSDLPDFQQETGFQVHHTEIRVVGVCTDCAAAGAQEIV